MPLQNSLQLIAYGAGAVTFVLTSLRAVFSWFNDYSNATRFTQDMALNHLPYIYRSLRKIGESMNLEVEPEPFINFTKQQ